MIMLKAAFFLQVILALQFAFFSLLALKLHTPHFMSSVHFLNLL